MKRLLVPQYGELHYCNCKYTCRQCKLKVRAKRLCAFHPFGQATCPLSRSFAPKPLAVHISSVPFRRPRRLTNAVVTAQVKNVAGKTVVKYLYFSRLSAVWFCDFTRVGVSRSDAFSCLASEDDKT